MISVVIPNYNGEELLKKNLPQVVEESKKYHGEKEIILVDDASEDDSLAFLHTFMLHTKSVPIHILQNKRNKGFSSTVNKGVMLAKGDILVLLNTDVSPQEDFLNPLLEHF